MVVDNRTFKCRLSFVIVNYNALNFTLACIASIRSNLAQIDKFEIIVVDNSPLTEQFEYLQQYILDQDATETKVLRTENKGFGNANNIGIRYASGDIIFILNNDAELLNFIEIDEIMNLLARPGLGVIAPKVIYPDGRLQPNCSTFLNPFSSLLRFLRVGQILYNNKFFSWLIRTLFSKTSKVASSYFNREQNSLEAKFVDWASGCALIFKRTDFIKMGGFDEGFFMYFEDEELCYRFHKQNKNVYYLPNILISHHVGASSNQVNSKIEIEKIKSEFYFYYKHFPDKRKKLRILYKLISLVLSPCSKRFKIISSAFQKRAI